jgi:hypothetical protein
LNSIDRNAYIKKISWIAPGIRRRSVLSTAEPDAFRDFQVFRKEKFGLVFSSRDGGQVGFFSMLAIPSISANGGCFAAPALRRR